jgi:shikimate kinase
MRTFPAPTIVFCWFATVLAANAGTCVENAPDSGGHFIVAIDGHGRAAADLAPKGRLCLSGSGPATVAVFSDQSDIEGCSRRVGPDSATRLIDFPGVDLCDWETDPGH